MRPGQIMLLVFFVLCVVIVFKIISEEKKAKNRLQRKTENVKAEPAENKIEITKNKKQNKGYWKYKRKNHLLYKDERKLFALLKIAFPEKLIFSEVSMSQMFWRLNYYQLNKIGKKSIDFVICEEDTSIIAAIELNGPHHEQQKQIERDIIKKEALEEAGIPLLVYYPDKLPSIEKIIRDVQQIR